MAAGDSALPYQLTVDGFAAGHFRVHSFKGKETISEAWAFDVVATAEAGDQLEQGALGKRAMLLFNVAETQRAFYGIVAAVRLAEVNQVSHMIRYHLRVVPRLWLLKRKRRTRIFQKMRVPDIVTAVLLEAGIAARWQLTRAYPEREYCTQYEETDYHFVRRLLAEAGIYFYFPEGPPIDDAAFAADAALGAAAAAGSSVIGAVAGQAVGSLAGSAASMAETLIPGDTFIGADDAACYPPLRGDDAAALAASTAAALAPAIGDVLGAGDGIAGAAIGAASAVAGTVIATAEGARSVPVLRFLDNQEAAVTKRDKVTRFILRNTVRSSAAAFREYDPDKPMVRLQSVAVSTDPFPPSPFEIAAMAAAAAENVVTAAETVVPGAAGALSAVDSAISTVDNVVNEVGGALGQKVGFEVYEHHSPFLFPKWAFGGDEAPRILRQKRRRASIASGEGGCSDLTPGHRFALDDHPAAQLDGGYVVTSVEHRGETHPQHGGQWKVYENTFECTPDVLTYVPPRPRRRSVQVSLTATVVGPGGEEIHVDEKGQIKVQFHWDRDGKHDENSSCWIRTMQPWAGAGWGHQFIPRVGMEVVVTFEGGDPDKPMVIGSLYNGTHPPPFKLPEHKTRSGIRTHSTPHGAGSNEISFEDMAGNEQIYVHAQKNYDEVVEKNQTSRVGGRRAVLVDLGASERIGKEHTLDVVEDRTTTVGGSDVFTVEGRWQGEVKGDRTLIVHGASTGAVRGAASLEVQGNRSLLVGTPKEPAHSDHFVFGTASLAATERLVLRADEGVVLQCGDATIELTKDKITLSAPTIELNAKESLSAASAKGPSLTLGDHAEILAKSFKLFTESGAVEVDKEVKVKGSAIKLGYDPAKPSKSDTSSDKKTQSFTCKLTNYFLAPYKNKKYHLMAEGLRFEGETDGEGTVKQDIPDAARQAVIRLWVDDYPEGAQQLYTIDIKDDLPPETSVEGAKIRLKNLGYYDGPVNTVADDEFHAALAEFQYDHRETHGLEPTGELDGGTAGALQEVHGS
jgi:type VI secretion system secreted protein VgrG